MLRNIVLICLVFSMFGVVFAGLEPTDADRVELLVHLEELAGRTLDEHAVAGARTLDDLTRAMSVPPSPPLAMPRWSRHAVARAARTLGRGLVISPMFRTLFRLHVSGEGHLKDLRPPFLLVANHESHLDTGAVLFGLPGHLRPFMAVAMATEHLPGAFDAKTKNAWLHRQAYRGLVLMFNAYPLPRSGGFSVTLDYTGELVESGFCPLIFPEGRMGKAGEKPPAFRDGPSVLARDLRLPVVPVGLRGTCVALPPGSRRPRPGIITVRFGTPLMVAPDEEREIGRFTRRLEATVRRLVEG